MTTDQTYSCQRCTRTDLKLTLNGRVKSHAADGKRAHPETNPHCPGGSDWPREHVRDLARQGDGAAAAQLVSWGEDPSGDGTADNRPTEQEVRDAETVTVSPSAPDDVFSAAEAVLRMAADLGVQGSVHTHKFAYGDDGNGHSGSFCACGEEEKTASASGAYGVGPNRHRAPLPTGRLEAAATTGEGSWQESRTTSPHSSPEPTGGPTSAPSSGRGSTASATSAGTPSSKETTSEPPKVTISMTNASKTGSPAAAVAENEATTYVNSGVPASNAVPRDRWGRYLLPHPATGQQQPWTRATTLASSVADTFALSMWSQRMVAKGLTLRPDLFALASTYDVSADKDDLNAVCDQAKAAAGDKVAANLGTAMHAFTAAVDQGRKPNVPASMRSDVDAYSAILRGIGLEIVPYLIERRTAITSLKEDVAGTFDRVYRVVRDIRIKLADGTTVRLKAGDYVIGDLKTGRDLAYGWGEIAIQEALYAHGINENGIWDPDAKVWLRPHDMENASVSLSVREDVGIVVHLPIQKTPGLAACTVYAVDLAQGWEATQLCTAVRRWRKAKQLATPLEVIDQAPREVIDQAPREDTRQLNATPGSGYTGRAPVTDETVPYADRPERKDMPGYQADENDRMDANRVPGGSAYNRPTAAQLAGHPSVAGESPAPAVRKPTWEDRAAAVTTNAEASAVYKAMRPHYQKIGAERFNRVVKSMQERLASLVEKAG